MAEYFDTNLEDKDIEIIGQINKIKKRIISLFKPEVIVDAIKTNINESQVLGFTNKRSEKFINVAKPTFMISMYNEQCNEKYPHGQFTNEDKEIEWLSDILYKEVIAPFSSFLHQSVKDKSTSNDWDQVFKENPEIAADLEFLILTSVFGMRVDLQKYTVNLEYMV